jgi:hypothetical protein
LASKASINISANVGMLLTSREVSGYEDYYGVDFGEDSSEIRLGVVIRSGSANPRHVVLQIDCKGHGFTQAPDAMVRIVRTAIPANPVPPSLTASVFAWEDDQAFIAFDGSLENGDNIVLLAANAASDQTQRLLANPLNLSAPAPASPTSGGGPECTPRCIPPAVGGSNSCTPPAPEATPGCPAPTPQGSANCTGDSTPVGGPSCGYQGDNATLSGTIGVTGSVSTGWKIGGDGSGLEISQNYTGSISGAFSFSLGVVNQNGPNGCASCNDGLDMCGTCRALCVKSATCKLSFNVVRDGSRIVETGNDHGRLWYRVKTPCSENSVVSQTCYKWLGTDGALCERQCP